MKIKDLIKKPRRNAPVSVAKSSDNPIIALREEFNRLFDQLMGDFHPRFLENLSAVDFPKVDIKDKAKEIIVEAELPGMDQNDVHVRVDENLLTIYGEKRQEKEEEKSDYYLCERSYGSFHRVIVLPDEVEADKAQASYRRGILKIKLPKKPESQRKSKMIKIE